MPLESLLELVETLGDRIDRHGPALKQSEALTRYALIDPLLRELGWDTSDPWMVMPEYRVRIFRADYRYLHFVEKFSVPLSPALYRRFHKLSCKRQLAFAI